MLQLHVLLGLGLLAWCSLTSASLLSLQQPPVSSTIHAALPWVPSFITPTTHPPTCHPTPPPNHTPRSLPYAFHHLPLSGLPDGFPIWFDINLSEDGAQTWYNWVQQGLLLDDRTRGLQAQLVTYNPELQVFGDVLLRFEFSDGGTISVSGRGRQGQGVYSGIPFVLDLRLQEVRQGPACRKRLVA